VAKHVLTAELVDRVVHCTAHTAHSLAEPTRLPQPSSLPHPTRPPSNLPHINIGNLIPANGIDLPIRLEHLLELLISLLIDLIPRGIHKQQGGIPISLQVGDQPLQPLRRQVIELHLDEFEGFRERYRGTQGLKSLVLQLIVRNIQIFEAG
jgi:hypothetical protein